jgi:hypothetical protein
MNEPGTVTLIDGTQVRSDSEAWRHECEARRTLTLPADYRHIYLAEVARRRGDAAADALRETMIRLRSRS